jgi:hypothetical protein
MVENFDNAMDALLTISHGQIKAQLDAEKAARFPGQEEPQASRAKG